LSCWKTDTNPNAGWTEWQPFFGSNIPIFGSDVNAVTVAPLSDGRLQLWGNITNGALFTTWKETIDPNAAWSPWSPFPTP
jgi:hypothetical protein